MPRISLAKWPTLTCRPKANALKGHDEFGSIESIKTVNALFMPVDGEIIEVNANLGGRARNSERGLLRRGLACANQSGQCRGCGQANGCGKHTGRRWGRNLPVCFMDAVA